MNGVGTEKLVANSSMLPTRSTGVSHAGLDAHAQSAQNEVTTVMPRSAPTEKYMPISGSSSSVSCSASKRYACDLSCWGRVSRARRGEGRTKTRYAM